MVDLPISLERHLRLLEKTFELQYILSKIRQVMENNLCDGHLSGDASVESFVAELCVAIEGV